MTGLTLKNFGEVTSSVFDFTYQKIILVMTGYLIQYLFHTKENMITIITPILILAMIDTVTGYLYALRSKQIDSNKLSKVMVKAFSYGAYIIMGSTIDAEVGTFALMGITAPKMVAIFKYMIIVNEAHSILENLAKLDFPIPEYIKGFLKDFSNDGKKKLMDNLINDKSDNTEKPNSTGENQ